MASSPFAQVQGLDQTSQMVQLATFSLPTTSARIKAHTLKYCPTMDLMAAALEDESWNVWRLGGSRVFGGSGFSREPNGRHTEPGRLGVSAMEWKANGMLLAITCTDNTTRLVSTHNGKVVHLLKTDLPMDTSSVSCLGWMVNNTGPLDQLLKTKANGNAPLENFLESKSSSPSSAIKPDLPRELALIDVEASFPKLSSLPASGIDDDVFSSKASLDAMFHATEGADSTDSVDVLVIGFDDGAVLLKIFDSFEVGKVDISSAFSGGKCKILRHASHAMSPIHSFVVTREGPGKEAELFVVNMSLRFISASPRYLSVVVAKSTQLQNLLRYIGQVQTQISLEWKTAQDLPSKFLRNINESLKEKSECDFVTAAYHLVVTGDCYPPLKEFLVDELGERGHKRWEKAVMNGYETIRRLVHECFLPAIERCQIVTSRLKGLAGFRKAGGVLGLDHDALDAVDDTLDCLNMLGHRLLIVIGKELQQFTAFAKWLRLEIDIQATDPDVSNVDDLLERQDNIEHRHVLDYISGAISDSQVLRYIRPTVGKDDDNASPWAPSDPQGSYYKQYKSSFQHRQNGDDEQASQVPKLDDLTSFLKQQCETIFSQIADSIRKSILFSSPISIPTSFDKNVMDTRILQSGESQESPQSIRNLIVARQGSADIAFLELPLSKLAKVPQGDQRLVPIHTDTQDPILDVKFVDDETIMVLRGNSTEARIECWNYSDMDEISMEIRHVFDYSATKSKPLKLEVNGRKTRRAVCVLFEDRRSYAVFDIDNAVEAEEIAAEGDAGDATGDIEMQ